MQRFLNQFRANHRRRRYPTLDKYIFPEISKGVPIPVSILILIRKFMINNFFFKIGYRGLIAYPFQKNSIAEVSPINQGLFKIW